MRMRGIVNLVIWPVIAFAQTTAPSAALPTFEVASVKLALEASSLTEAERDRGWGGITGRVNLRGIPLRMVLLRAFGIDGFQLTAPDWVNTAYYDILANVPTGAPKEQVPLMFQALLAERFNLKFHRETKVTQVYAMVVAEGGPKLKEASPDESVDAANPSSRMNVTSGGGTVTGVGSSEYGTLHYTMDISRNTIHAEYAHMSMKALAEALSGGGLGLPVVDMTDLRGFYRVAIDNHISTSLSSLNQGIDQPVPTASDPSGDPVRESLQKQGLKLVRREVPMEKVIVDHIEKTPTGN